MHTFISRFINAITLIPDDTLLHKYFPPFINSACDNKLRCKGSSPGNTLREPVVLICVRRTRSNGVSHSQEEVFSMSLSSVLPFFLPQTFSGNWNSERAVRNDLQHPFMARFVRFIPLDWSEEGRIGLRVELYGCAYCECCGSDPWCIFHTF